MAVACLLVVTVTTLAAATPATADAASDARVVSDLPDPSAVMASGGPVVYATNTEHEGQWLNVPAMSTVRGAPTVIDALPTVPSWSVPGFVWAPSVWHVQEAAAGADGDAGTDAVDHWVMYVTTHHLESGRQCVAVATATSAFSTFASTDDEPLVCQASAGGTIDASPFVADDGSRWLLFKNDGNCCGLATTIWSQQLDASGTELVGEPHALLTAQPGWEGGLIEGPSMLVDDDELHLFYSANRWDTGDYAIGHAHCDGPTGPCVRSSDAPWMSSDDGLAGPGGQEFMTLRNGRTVMVLHAWDPDAVGYERDGARSLHVRRVEVTDGDPTMVNRRS